MKNIKCVSKLSSALRMKNGGKLFSQVKHSLGQEQPQEHQKLAKRARSALGGTPQLKKQSSSSLKLEGLCEEEAAMQNNILSRKPSYAIEYQHAEAIKYHNFKLNDPGINFKAVDYGKTPSKFRNQKHCP